MYIALVPESEKSTIHHNSYILSSNEWTLRIDWASTAQGISDLKMKTMLGIYKPRQFQVGSIMKVKGMNIE